MINVWNSLSDEVVSTNQLPRFKTHIKQVNLNNFLIGKAWLLYCFSPSPQWFWCYYAYVYFWSRTCKWCHHPSSTMRHWVLCLCLFYAYFNVLLICLQNIWIWISANSSTLDLSVFLIPQPNQQSKLTSSYRVFLLHTSPFIISAATTISSSEILRTIGNTKFQTFSSTRFP